MPVGLRGGDLRRGDGATRAAAIVHHHRRAELVLQVPGELARDAVGAPARREGNDERDRALLGEGLRLRERGDECRDREEDESDFHRL